MNCLCNFQMTQLLHEIAKIITIPPIYNYTLNLKSYYKYLYDFEYAKIY